MKHFIYTRKSTEAEDRQVLSIDAQLRELRSFAEKERLTIIDEFTECRTAKDPGRPVFNEMMKRIQDGDAEGIVAWHPDRLARNPVEGGLVVHLLATGKLQSLRFPTFWFENTPQGKFVLNIAFGQSQYVVDSLSESVKRGIREKLHRGEYPGWAPIGYLNDPRKHSIEVDEIKAPLVQRLFEAYATGRYLPADLHRMANAWDLRGHLGKPIALSKIPVLLSNPFYIGLFRYRGEVHEGRHKAIVPRETFDQVQKILRKRSRGAYKSTDLFPLRGFMSCDDCGCAVTAELQKEKRYYHCTKRKGPCSSGYFREERLARKVRQSIRLISLSDEWAALMLAQIEKEEREEAESILAALERQKAKLADVEARQDRLLDVYIEGSITREEFATRKERFIREKTVLQENLDRLQRGEAVRFERLKNFIKQAHEAQKVAESENLSELKDFHVLLGSNLVLAGLLSEDAARSASEFLAPNPRGRKGGKVLHHDGDAVASQSTILLKTREIPSHPVHVPMLGTSDFCLPEKSKRAASLSGGALKIHSRSLPVVCVKYPNPFHFLAHWPKTSEWRAPLTYARTIYDADYCCDMEQFKVNIVYVVPGLGP